MVNEPRASTFLSTPGNSFVLPEHKMVYVSTTKVACTSLKWMVADLAGEDLERFRGGASRVQSRLMKIHKGRGRFQHVKGLKHLTPDELDQINPENGWFVFGLLRDPWSRLWSAWESKFLVRHNRYVENFGDEPFFPRVPTEASFVVEDFRRFVELHPWTSNPILRDDHHFQPQVPWLKPDKIPYTRIYDLRDFSTFIRDVHDHLRGLGKDQELYIPRANETPLAMTREVMGGGVKERIEELYHEDFEVYGHRWDFDSLSFAPDGWNRDALSHAAYHTEINAWLNQINSVSERRRKERNQLAREVKAAKRRIARLERENEGLRRAANQRSSSASVLDRVRRAPQRLAGGSGRS